MDKVLNQASSAPRSAAHVSSPWSSRPWWCRPITSFSLTQLLSKAGQRLIAEMRRQVQRHVGLLSVSYYDENRTGTLVARIMTDVEGVRNLVGTGLVEFVGGLLTAVLAFIYLLHLSVTVTLTVFAVMGAFVFVLQYAFRVIRPIFRERGKINAEVTGRLTESLGGVRVIKGYHAEEREAGVFSAGVERLLANVMKSLTMTSVAGCRLHHRARPGFGHRDVAGRPSRPGQHLDRRRLLQLQHVSRLHDRAGLPDREHRHATDRGLRRPGPHQRDHVRAGREPEPRPHREDAAHPGHGAL